MAYTLPPIVRLAEALMRDTELAVEHFARRHRYTIGSRLSAQAFEVTVCAHKAWADRQSSAPVDALADEIDRLKLIMQLAQQVKAFTSFAQFEALARVAADLGRQCGGWRKKRTSQRQNGPEPAAPAQRPQILSSRAASSEAKP